MISKNIFFEDRRDAGRQLAERLQKYRGENVVVLALPRGGVPVGFEIARSLDAPLDVIVARKLGAPMQPELGIGAIAPGGIMLLDESTTKALGISPEEIAAVAAQEQDEMNRRLKYYRGDGLPDVKGRIVILVDDGLATGVTAAAAIEAIRTLEPEKIILAIPVCARKTADALADEVEEIICVSLPDQFRAVGLWYKNFSQTTDNEVIALLKDASEHAQTSERRPRIGEALK